MKIQKEFTDDHQVKIVAEFESELMEQYKHRAARKLSKRTKIHGFRPGKAPYAVIVSQLGELAITQEALDMLLEEEYPKVIDEAEIKPSGPGNLEKIESETPPILHFRVPLEPEIELGEVDLSKTYEPAPFDESKVDDFIRGIQRNGATIVPLESAAEEGNVIYMRLVAETGSKDKKEVLDDAPLQVLIPTEKEEQDSEYPYRGFSRKLIGHKAGEKITSTHKFDVDCKIEKFCGKKVSFTADIESVKGLELPELEGEFLESIGPYKTAEDLRAAVHAHLSHEEQSAYDDAYYLELVDKIREASKIKYPPQVLEEEIEKVLHRVEDDLKRQNLDLETYFKLRQTDREKFIEEEAKPAAIARLERSLIMDAFAKKHDIKLNDKKLKSAIDKVVTELVMDGSLNDLQKELGTQKFYNAVTMEAANRQMEIEIRKHLKSMATGEPLPTEEEETPAAEIEPETDLQEELQEADIVLAEESIESAADADGQAEETDESESDAQV